MFTNYVSCACGDQRRAPDPLELNLQMTVSRHVGPLQEQQGLLTSELPLQSPCPLLPGLLKTTSHHSLAEKAHLRSYAHSSQSHLPEHSQGDLHNSLLPALGPLLPHP